MLLRSCVNECLHRVRRREPSWRADTRGPIRWSRSEEAESRRPFREAESRPFRGDRSERTVLMGSKHIPKLKRGPFCSPMGLRADWTARQWGNAPMGQCADGAPRRLDSSPMGQCADGAVRRWGSAPIGLLADGASRRWGSADEAERRLGSAPMGLRADGAMRRWGSDEVARRWSCAPTDV